MDQIKNSDKTSSFNLALKILIFIAVIAIIASFFDTGLKAIGLKNQLGNWLSVAGEKMGK